MYVKYLFYKLLRIIRLLSDSEFKKKTASYSRAYRVVSKAKFFDKKWYKEQYLTENSNFSAIEHYIKYGFKEGKIPYVNFDPSTFFASPYPKYFYTLESSHSQKKKIDTQSEENKISSFNAKKRKILLFSHEFSLTGAPRALLNMAKTMQEQGYNPVILSPKFGDLEKELKHYGIEYYVEPLLLLKLLFNDIDVKNFFNSFERILFNTIITLRYAPYIQAKNKKIVWVHEAKWGFEREGLSHNLKEHFSYIDEAYSVGEYSKASTDIYINPLYSKVLLYALDKLEIPLLSRYKTKPLSFILVGFCSERKGHDIFVKAVQNLPEEIRNLCSFSIVGKFDKRKFSKKIKSIAEQEGITCTGQIPYKETLQEIAQADVLVCPSRDDPMPMVCTEALMLKKTVICSDKTGISAFIKEGLNGYIFHLEKDNLSDIIVKAYNNREKLDSIGEQAEQIYDKNFTHEILGEKVKELLD